MHTIAQGNLFQRYESALKNELHLFFIKYIQNSYLKMTNVLIEKDRSC